MEITEFFGNTLNCIYGLLLGAGFIYSLLLLFGSDLLGDIGIDLDLDLDHDIDLDLDGDGGHEAMGISTIAIASGVTTAGAVGIIIRALGLAEATSLVAAILAGLIVGGLAQVFFIYILKPTTNTSYSTDKLIGSSAEVITPIPEGSVGQIAVVASGSRVTLGARTTDGSSIGRGMTVRIHKVMGGVAYVYPEAGHPWA
ncbi:MAG: hypothetical protein JXB47_13990 [Anaerolineae bacterium]|nr:hypothetical protein [Anaerolineae bacterium]